MYGHAFVDVQSQGLWGLAFPHPTGLINMSLSNTSTCNTQDTPPNNIFAAINVRINDNK